MDLVLRLLSPPPSCLKADRKGENVENEQKLKSHKNKAVDEFDDGFALLDALIPNCVYFTAIGSHAIHTAVQPSRKSLVSFILL